MGVTGGEEARILAAAGARNQSAGPDDYRHIRYTELKNRLAPSLQEQARSDP